MLETLDQIDRSIFLFLNDLHASWLDPIMWFITGKKEWIPFYIIITVYIFWKFRWHGFVVLAGVGLTILLADQFSSGFCKPFFERLRPSHQPDLEGMVHTVNGYKGGKYGFISSHAANTFGLATFLFFVFRRYLSAVWLMFIWAGLVSYSRIYVGVHYPGDILAGAIAGALFGWLSWRLLLLVADKLGLKELSVP